MWTFELTIILMYMGMTEMMKLSSASGTGVPVLHRSIEKAGFHRELTTSLTIPVDQLPELDSNIECQVMFSETFPSGAYVDQYQLSSLSQFGGPDFLLKDAVDLEKPEFMSTGFMLHIFTNVSFINDVWTCSYTLPVHLRYHAVSLQDFANVTFENPEVGIICRDKITHGLNYDGYSGPSLKLINGPCGSGSPGLCDWTKLQYHMTTDMLSVRVPVGKSDHFYIVTIGTVVITVTACMILGYKVLTTDTKTKIH